MLQSTPFTNADIDCLQGALDVLVDGGGSPGGVVVCGTRDAGRQILTAGLVAPECGDVRPDEHTFHDVASLTKVVATWPLVGQALDQGLFDLDAPIRDFLPTIHAEAPSGEATVRQLLTHTSGLRASTRLDQYRGAGVPLHELMCREPLDEQPGRHRYINRGYILLGLALAHVHNQPLHVLAAQFWSGIGMTSTLYGPVARTSQVAPTEQRVLGAPRTWGAPHDDNAALLGGIAGHAGVFSTPADLAAYAEHLLTAHGNSPIGQWLHASRVPQTVIEPGLDRGLSWILTDGGQTAYHHGFTGTSLYLNPEHGRYLVFCSNAVYHGPARERLAPLRAVALKAVSSN